VLYSVYFCHPIPFKKNNGINLVVEVEKEGEIGLHDDSDNDNENNHNHHQIKIPDNRSRIYEYIKNKPGSHLREISKELIIAMGDTQYHLGILEKSGLVKSKRIGIYKVYYPVSILEGREESILSYTSTRDTKGNSYTYSRTSWSHAK
jgi:predicted DNA-binding transcriptional regulator